MEYALGSSPIPLYRKIEEKLLSHIATGQIKEGDLLPSEMDLAKEFKVHQGTVRKSILNLTRKGILYRKQGRGTFVVFKKNNIEKYRNNRFVTDQSSQTIGINFSVISMTVVQADSTIKKALNLKKGSKIIQLERIGKIENRDVIKTVSYLPKSLYPGLEKFTNEDFTKNTLWKIQESCFKIEIKKREEYISAIAANSDIAAQLCTTAGDSILKISMSAITNRNEICEFRLTFCTLDQLQFYHQLV